MLRWGSRLATEGQGAKLDSEKKGSGSQTRTIDRFQSRDLILISRHIGAHHLPVNIWPEVVFIIKNGFMRDF